MVGKETAFVAIATVNAIKSNDPHTGRSALGPVEWSSNQDAMANPPENVCPVLSGSSSNIAHFSIPLKVNSNWMVVFAIEMAQTVPICGFFKMVKEHGKDHSLI